MVLKGFPIATWKNHLLDSPGASGINCGSRCGGETVQRSFMETLKVETGVGIEPTTGPCGASATGFEDQPAHQDDTRLVKIPC